MDIITDLNGINYLTSKPKEGQICQTKIKGESGYCSKTKYTNGCFETYAEEGNRMVITRWKVDLWLPAAKQ